MSLGPDARSLIAAADGADDPSSADEARVRAKLAARLAVAAGTGIAATTAAKTATASAGTAATTTLAAKIAIGVAVVSATTGTAVLYERSTHHDAPTVVEVPRPKVFSPLVSSATASPIPSPSAAPVPSSPMVTSVTSSKIAPPPPPKPKSTAMVANDTIAEEASLLRAAHAALASGDGATAMTSLDEHARRFPRGALTEEREAARVMALCAQGRASEARASASAFVSANPRSPFAAQVRRSCATKSDE